MRSIRSASAPLLVGCVLSLVSGSAAAEDLMGVYELALDYDKTFSAARNTYKAVQQTQQQANGLYYPNLSASYEHSETNQEIVRSDNEVFGSGKSDFPSDVASISLDQPVFRMDFLRERKIAKAEVRQAEYQFVAAEQELMLRAAEAYLLALAAQDNLEVTRSELEAVGQQLALAEKRLEVGLGDATQVHESRARYELTQAEVLQAENEVIDRLEALRTISGQIPGQLDPLQDDFTMTDPDPADPQVWIDQALENNLLINARGAAVDAARAEYKRQRADRYPTVDMVASYNNRDTGGSLFGGGSEVNTAEVLVVAQWDIFEGRVRGGRIKEAFYNMQRAQDELRLEHDRVRRETRNAYLGVVTSIARASALKSSLEAQRITVRAKEKGFETGANSNLEVLDAKRDLYFVKRDYLEARYDYLLSLLNLKLQVGQLSPEDLESIDDLLKSPG